MAGKKDFGGVPTKPKSMQDFIDGSPAPAPAQEAKPEPQAPAKRPAKNEQLARWGTYSVQRGYRVPIVVLEALQGYVAEQQKTDRRYNETQAVVEAVTKYLQEKGIAV